MTTCIRDAVFETNSSSSHSVTVSASDMRDDSFPQHMLRDGRIEVSLGEFGWEKSTYREPLEKLSYLLTQAKEDATTTRAIIEAVQEHTGCSVVIDADSIAMSYVDHQSAGVGMEVVEDPEQLMGFLLSSSSYVQTDNDNDTEDYGWGR
jgi:hypothetical protein